MNRTHAMEIHNFQHTDIHAISLVLFDFILGYTPMPVRNAESRISATNSQDSESGQADMTNNSRCESVSVFVVLLVVNRENVYVVFVTDAALAAVAQPFEWTYAENGGAPNAETTQHREVFYHRNLNLMVRILGVSNTTPALASLILTCRSEAAILIREISWLIRVRPHFVCGKEGGRRGK